MSTAPAPSSPTKDDLEQSVFTKTTEKPQGSTLTAAELQAELSNYIWNKIDVLWTTGETLDDIGFATAHEVYSKRTSIYFWGSFKRWSMFIIFIVLFVQNFQGMYETQKFLTLDETSGNCEPVGKSWTISALLADKNGNWQGSQDFSANNAVYQFTMYSFSATQKEFVAWLQKIKAAIAKVGQTSTDRDLSYNLLLWSSWSHDEPTTDPVSGEQTIQRVILNGDAQYIMNNEGLQGSIGSQKGDCDIFASSQSYNLPGSSFSFDINMDTFMGSPSCYGPAGVMPSSSLAKRLGWDKSVSGPTLSISIDSHSLFTALAVSYRVNGVNTLDKFVRIAEVAKATWYYDKKEYTLVDVYDDNYPGMSPVTCVGPTDGDSSEWNCFLRIGDSYGIPVLQHKGSDSTTATRCVCGSGTLPADCQKLNLLVGVIVYDHLRFAPSSHHATTNAVFTGTTVDPDSWAVFAGYYVATTGTSGTLTITAIYEGIVQDNVYINAATGSGMLTTSSCQASVKAGGVGTCTLSIASGTIPTVGSSSSPVTLSTGAQASSNVLLVTATTSGKVGNMMTITSTGFVGTATTSSCYLVSSVGTCTLSKALNLQTISITGQADSTDQKTVTFSTEYDSMPDKFKPVMPLLEVFYISPPISAEEASKKAFEAAFSVIFGQDCSSGESCTQKPTFSDSDTRSGWYDFSNTWHYGTGTLIMMNSFSNLQTSISADNLQLVNGACNDVIMSSNFGKLEENAWGRLTEVYYQCTALLGDAILNAMGIAAGTAGLLVPTVFYILMFGAMGLHVYNMKRKGISTCFALPCYPFRHRRLLPLRNLVLPLTNLSL